MSIVPDHLLARTVNLLFNVGQAVNLPWVGLAPAVQLPRSIFGDPGSLTRSTPEVRSELAAFQGDYRSALATLASAVVSVPFANLLREASGPFLHPGRFAGAFPNERWLFVNGIATTRSIAAINADAVCELFRRPVTVLYNRTEGITYDLLESAAGKGFDAITESVAANLDPLVDALCDPTVERVVVIAHSQGTIVTSALLKSLEEILDASQPRQVKSGPGAQKPSPERMVAKKVTGQRTRQPANARRAVAKAAALLAPAHIGKLEVYSFANCSTSMTPVVTLGPMPRHAPWLESYGNEFDGVARLGVLAPPHGIGSARIAGDRYRRAGMWGHLLNAHYLLPIQDDLRAGTNPPSTRLEPFSENLLRRPRLLDYLSGSVPANPYP